MISRAGLYAKIDKGNCLVQTGAFANRVIKATNLKPASCDTERALISLGWKRISSKHLAVWNDG